MIYEQPISNLVFVLIFATLGCVVVALLLWALFPFGGIWELIFFGICAIVTLLLDYRIACGDLRGIDINGNQITVIHLFSKDAIQVSKMAAYAGYSTRRYGRSPAHLFIYHSKGKLDFIPWGTNNGRDLVGELEKATGLQIENKERLFDA